MGPFSRLLGATVGVLIACLLAGPTAFAAPPAPTALPGIPGGEVEPNLTPAQASPIAAGTRTRAKLFPEGDVDLYRFTGQAGDRVMAAVITNGSTGSSTDSQLTVLESDGTTVVEFDDDNGSYAGFSSSISGATLPTSGTYYLKVNDFVPGTATIRQYDLYFDLRSAAATPEVEANDTPATANPFPGYVSGARNPAAATEQDWYSVSLNAGDTIFLSMDLDPERDGVTYNGRLGLALFGDVSNQVLVVDDAGTGDVSPVPNRPSEAMVYTVRTAGTYFVFADSASAGTGGPTATYALSGTVIPAATPSCRTTSVTPAAAIADGATTDVPIAVTDTALIGRAAVRIGLTHALMGDLDVSLVKPDGTEIGIVTDVGAAATGGQTKMDTTFDQFAAVPPVFTALRPMMLQPETAYRLQWLEGLRPQGTWNLRIRDDAANGNAGTVDAVDLILCDTPEPAAGETRFSATFESSDEGFTHSGAADEWERGTPATAATATANPVAGLSTCAEGSGCWKTDLDGTYGASSNQDLISPPIDLTSATGPLALRWWMWFQMDSASLDHLKVSIENVSTPSDSRTLYDWLDGMMTNAPGAPVEQVPAAAGWGAHDADISAFAGKTVRLRFHLDSDATSTNFAGLAVDDISIVEATKLLTVATSGGGFVTSSPAGIDCGTGGGHASCAKAFAQGGSVTLTPTAESGSTFAGWSGACTGTGGCTVTMDDARSVTAAFGLDPVASPTPGPTATPGSTPTPGPPPTSTPVPTVTPTPRPPATGSGGSLASQLVVGGASTKACTSKRKLTLRVKGPKGTSLRTVTATLRGRKLKVVKRGSEFRVTVNLAGKAKASYKVTIKVLTTAGKRATITRTYKTCRAKKRR